METARQQGGPAHDRRHHEPLPTSVPSWMSVGDARAVLVGHGLRSLPVHGHQGLIGLITVEALAGGEGAPPGPSATVGEVMDWHLVQVPVDADEAAILHAFEEAAWVWMRTRLQDAEPS